MIAQSQFTVVAPLAASREAELRTLLDSMNTAPGVFDPDNRVLRLGEFECLHFARLVILDDPTLADLEVYGMPEPRLPKSLAFLGDCDGPARAFLEDAAARASDGLRRVFSHCAGFEARTDLLAWMLAHDVPVGARYVNWVGRSVVQVREESALFALLAARVPRTTLASGADVQRVRRELIDCVEAEVRAGRLSLTPEPPTSLRWRLGHWLHALAVPLAGLAALPFFVVLLPLLLHRLRRLEEHDPEIFPRPEARALQALHDQEDHDVSNQYTAIGLVKPGRFRRWLLTLLLLLADYATRHIYNRGYLARVQTIHFARWVFLDGKRRVLFASNYDGSHQAYMDDFINKVAWGLNLLFSNGVGWPRTRWLVFGGARIEHRFKRYQRRHQLPTQVWYKAYPGLALVDLARNQRIREGLQCRSMSDSQALAWLKLL